MTTSTATTAANAFRVGQIVDTGRGDYVWTFEVIKRTAKFVTLKDITHGDNGDTYRVGVYQYDDVESALPFGRYSMAPVVRAI